MSVFILRKKFIKCQRIILGDAWTLRVWSVITLLCFDPFFFFFFPSWEQFFHITLLEEVFASRNKAFFCAKKKERLISILLWRKKDLRSVATKKIASCFEGKKYCESWTKIKCLKKRLLIHEFRVRLEGFHKIIFNRISTNSCTCLSTVIIVFSWPLCESASFHLLEKYYAEAKKMFFATEVFWTK